VIFALGNVLAIALNNVWAGVASRRLPVYVVLVVASPVALGVSIVAWVVDPALWAMEAVLLGLSAGLAGGLGLLAGYRALAIGPIGTVTAIFASTATAFLVVAGLFFAPSIGWATVAVLGLCLTAIFLVTRDNRPSHVRFPAMVLGIFGGLGAGLFVLLMSFTSDEDGFTPVVAVRGGVLIVAVVGAVILRKTFQRRLLQATPIRWWLAAAAAGVMDAVANIFLLVAIRSLDLMTVAIIGSTTPAVTALIGWLVLQERLLVSQRVGVVLAVVAVAFHRMVS
jgi:drug/metabolite transporter (DMT)-like permease